MSSDIEKLNAGIKFGDTKESIIKSLLGKKNWETATEIPDVAKMACLEVMQIWLSGDNEARKIMGIKEDRKITSSDLLLYFLYRFKIDAISHQRKSRAETVTAIKNLEDTSLLEKKQVLKGLFG